MTQLYGWTADQLPTRKSISNFLNKKIASSPKGNLKFSIIIPTLNQGETIEDTLISIIAQNYSNTEIIVIDGGSTDNTHNVINTYQKFINYYCSSNDGGQSEAINHGFSQATGDIYAWINSDDYYLPYTFDIVAQTFSANPSACVSIGSGDIITIDNKFLRHIPALPLTHSTMINWRNGQFFMQQSCFWRNTLWSRVGGVDESLKLLMDYDLWFRFSQITNAYLIEETLAAMRYHPSAKTVRHRNLSTQEMAYVLAKHSAADSVREVVAQVANERDNYREFLNKLNKSIPIRLLKRLGFIPKF